VRLFSARLDTVGVCRRGRTALYGRPVPGPDLTTTARRRLARLLLAACALAVLAGCQVKVSVDTHVERDGSGEVTVGVGLDDKALARVGDLQEQVRVGDLAAAGWEVSGAEKASDGLTWLRASKRFGSIGELNAALAELTGEPAMVRDFRLSEEDAATAVVHHLTGTVDTTSGMARFSDPQLGARLGGDPVASRVAAVEAEEGQKVADMVTVDVTASLDGEGQQVHPRLDDPAPVRIETFVRDAKPPTSLGGGAPLGAMAVAGALVVAMLTVARRPVRPP
jgi:hypothetical protein